MDAEIVSEVREFIQEREGARDEVRNRADMIGDLRFCFEPGAQWDETAKAKRRGKPCYEYNRSAQAVNQIVGDQRLTQPSGKVRPTNKTTILDAASTFGGLIRDIEAQSAAPRIYSEAFKYAVAGGWGAWRIVPEYADGDSFDQVLRVKRIANPLTAYWDSLADPFGRDALQFAVVDRISRREYKAMFGHDAPTNIEVSGDSKSWFDDEQVRVAEYYRKETRKRKIVLLSDGRVFPENEVRDELEKMRSAGLQVPETLRERDVDHWYCTWYKCDGKEVVEGPIEYEYRHIPAIRLPGRFINIEGESFYQSRIRPGKDAARTYNYNRSAMVETVALTPRAPWLVTDVMINGYEDEWKNANVSNAPYLRFNIDPDNPGAIPQRSPGPEVPQALIALAMHDAEDIRQTMGYTNPAVEQQTRAGDAESGRALRTRLTAGDSGSYEFLDNMAQAIQFGWEIMVNMIPVTYDTKRIVRSLGEDGRESFVEFDPAALKDAQFDVTVTLGPSYATARMESLEMLLEASERIPGVADVAPDVIVANLDVKGAPEIERRLRRRMIAAGIVDPTEEEQAAMRPTAPDPTQVALEERMKAETALDKARAAKVSVETAEHMAKANSAERNEQIDLAQKIADLVMTQVETKLAQKELITPNLPKAGQ